jgi:hypothetical protein
MKTVLIPSESFAAANFFPGSARFFSFANPACLERLALDWSAFADGI